MDEPAPAGQPVRVSFREAASFWLKLGFINFGGPAGQIAILHQEVVEKRRWISSERFLHALNYCVLLPGPEAQQLATYVGWLLHGTPGGIVAGVLFILPGFFIMLALSWLYAAHGEAAAIAGVFYGLRAAVIAIVAAAVIRIGSKAIRSRTMAIVAAAAFVSIFFYNAPFPLVVLGAAAMGFFGSVLWPRAFPAAVGHPGSSPAGMVHIDELPRTARARPTLLCSVGVAALWVAIWWIPLGAVIVWRGADDILSREAVFFSKAAMVTFGGAYAVLTYILQAAVTTHGWIGPEQMTVGLGLAESTPGPLILVTEFVGFLGAYGKPSGLDPLVAGMLGALVTTWATFASSFLWIFLGAPYIELLRGSRRLDAALSTVTAAVSGVIASLAVWFTVHTLFARVHEWNGLGARVLVPDLATIDVFALVAACIAFFGMRRRRWGVIPVVLVCAAAGLLYRAWFPGASSR